MSRHPRWGHALRGKAAHSKSAPANLVILGQIGETRAVRRWTKAGQVYTEPVQRFRGIDRALWRAGRRLHRDGYLAGGKREAEKAAARYKVIAMRRMIAEFWARRDGSERKPQDAIQTEAAAS